MNPWNRGTGNWKPPARDRRRREQPLKNLVGVVTVDVFVAAVSAAVRKAVDLAVDDVAIRAALAAIFS